MTTDKSTFSRPWTPVTALIDMDGPSIYLKASRVKESHIIPIKIIEGLRRMTQDCRRGQRQNSSFGGHLGLLIRAVAQDPIMSKSDFTCNVSEVYKVRKEEVNTDQLIQKYVPFERKSWPNLSSVDRAKLLTARSPGLIHLFLSSNASRFMTS